jgi:hypothetical protein
MHRNITSPAAKPALPCFFTLSQKRHVVWKTVIEHKMSFEFLGKLCLKHFTLSAEFSNI